MELKKKYPISDEDITDRVIVRRLMKIYLFLQDRGAGEIEVGHADINRNNDTFEAVVTGWVDPSRADIVVQNLLQHMEYYTDEEINETNFCGELNIDNSHYKNSTDSDKVKKENVLPNYQRSPDASSDEGNISLTNLQPVGYYTMYFDKNLDIYHELIDGRKKVKAVKIRWRSEDPMMTANLAHPSCSIPPEYAENSSNNLFDSSVLDSSKTDDTFLEKIKNQAIENDKYVSIEMETVPEWWSGEISFVDRVFIPLDGVGDFLTSEYRVGKRRGKIGGNNRISLQNAQPYKIFQQIQRKIIIEKLAATLLTHANYMYFRDKANDPSVLVEVMMDLKVTRKDNMDGIDRIGDFWKHVTAEDNASNPSMSFPERDSVFFRPMVIKITLKEKKWPTWLYDMVFHNENIYWTFGFNAYVYGVAMLVEQYTTKLPYWCFEAGHPSISLIPYNSDYSRNSSDGSGGNSLKSVDMGPQGASYDPPAYDHACSSQKIGKNKFQLADFNPHYPNTPGVLLPNVEQGSVPTDTADIILSKTSFGKKNGRGYSSEIQLSGRPHFNNKSIGDMRSVTIPYNALRHSSVPMYLSVEANESNYANLKLLSSSKDVKRKLTGEKHFLIRHNSGPSYQSISVDANSSGSTQDFIVATNHNRNSSYRIARTIRFGFVLVLLVYTVTTLVIYIAGIQVPWHPWCKKHTSDWSV
ncbi:Vacuolar transporter chaperone 4 [Zancudomyces culisetae]|uniref:Vacuolar transporter chaperone 4 n=1 Tax=Zancudomyces culisetae TaxID=1213189 RepID=A0A1R1PLX5_ZANCU|nr:Vacuolar transporter chaperone 4 [Zancudomyces culisetae]|eukprot:OMH81956.1 Vacuolar transporter chaperone 4 [Zancudomyces culisetae]